MSSVGTDEDISASKIEPLESSVKRGVPHDDSSGVIGLDETINRARIEPVGGKGQYQHTAPHADSGGSVGRDETIASAKIDPMSGNKTADTRLPGLQDEDVDASRIAPLGEVSGFEEAVHGGDANNRGIYQLVSDLLIFGLMFRNECAKFDDDLLPDLHNNVAVRRTGKNNATLVVAQWCDGTFKEYWNDDCGIAFKRPVASAQTSLRFIVSICVHHRNSGLFASCKLHVVGRGKGTEPRAYYKYEIDRFGGDPVFD